MTFRTGWSLVLVLGLGLGGAAQAETPHWVVSPPNPELVDALTRGDHGGYLPSPVDRSHLVGQRIAGRERLRYPASFDLRTSSWSPLPPIRNQGSCGSCWTFSTMGILESSLGPDEVWDFSEDNLKNTHGWDRAPCAGGNMQMSSAYLLRWSGPVSEADDPYSPTSTTSPAGLTVRKHLQHAYFLPDRAGAADNDSIKDALTRFGGVATSMHFDQALVNETNDTYYYSGTANVDHGVIIVGWDDAFSRTRFTPAPPGDGAFIVRNSHGTTFGQSGYFYVSYHDTRIGKDSMVVPKPEPTDNYDFIHQYDPLGVTMHVGATGVETAWFANVFEASADQYPVAVGFYANALNSRALVYVYAGVTTGPRSGRLIASIATERTLEHAGFHTLRLDNVSELVRAGGKFSVVVRLTTPGTHLVVPCESAVAGVTSGATAAAGQGFISMDGTNWQDATSIVPTASVALKAYAVGPCGDNEPCTTDTWDGGKCVYASNSDACSDGLWCNGADVCSAGACTHPGRDCSDGLTCTNDSCDEANDRCVATVAAGWCAIGGSCHESAAANPANECERCDPAKATKAWSPLSGTSCDDGTRCTQGAPCEAGVCRETSETVCAALDECHLAGQCDPDTGGCSNPTKGDGQPCSQGQGVCVGGVCVPAGVDAGVEAPDSGLVQVDAGATPVDAGATPGVAGSTPVDAGSTPVDAGSTPMDAASTPVDAASTPVDAASTPVDAASTPMDAASTLQEDAGTEVDAQAADAGAPNLNADPEAIQVWGSGCGCGMTGSGGWWLGFVLLALLPRASRRARAHHGHGR